ncbi:MULTISPECIES: glycerophosphodiester phosphodiesterase family protein [Streptomyces]|uniref:GP-PDE domain-containing protein n=1 Tax=Streptomyces changanensis TaxID=2964669 RepID=A0ABY5NEL5_9ACTN|nr:MULTISPECIES: glycerophosphodiester phosphodiesterase family protein [Streptomyces]UUS34435.1 hypothetical protein NRO40_28840 [Streptomyces changanensis]
MRPTTWGVAAVTAALLTGTVQAGPAGAASLPLCPTVFGHGGYPTGPNSWERDQIRQPNHPRGLAQQKGWGASGVEADLQLTKDGATSVMWHNTTTNGLTGTRKAITELSWESGADPLKGRTITRGPYTGETVYTFREWLDSAASQGMIPLVELKGEARQSLLHTDPAIREAGWAEVISPMVERVGSQHIMIYTHDATLKPELERRVLEAGLASSLTGHPYWVDGIGWEEPPPAASGNHASWEQELALRGSTTTSVRMATSWTADFTAWLSERCV